MKTALRALLGVSILIVVTFCFRLLSEKQPSVQNHTVITAKSADAGGDRAATDLPNIEFAKNGKSESNAAKKTSQRESNN